MPVIEVLELGDGLLLDPRLALVHREQRWLAVADLHLGYEFQRRKHGGLYPNWGMQTICDRLLEIGSDYAGCRFLLLGDLVDAPSRKLADKLRQLMEDLGEEVVLVRGNHDGAIEIPGFPFVERHEEDGWCFVHGHEELPDVEAGTTIVHGHLHPGWTLRDGAGTRATCPAFVFERGPDDSRRWVLPAFSPWTRGAGYEPVGEAPAIYVSTRRKVLPISAFP